MLYDSVCMNMECIKQKKAFFEFHPKNQHTLYKHEIRNLATDAQSYEFSNQDIDSQEKYLKGMQMLKELMAFRNEACQKIIELVLYIFHENSFIENFEESLELFKDISIQNVLTYLRKGNYSLLHPIKLFQMQDKQPNFLNFFFQSLQDKHQSIKNNFESFTISLMETLQSLRRSFQPPKSVEIIQSQSPSQLSFYQSESVEIEEKESQNALNLDNEEEQYNQIIKDRRDSLRQKINIEKQYLKIQSQQKKMQKTKKRKSKSIYKRQPEKLQKRRRKKFNIENTYQCISSEEFLVFQSKNIPKTLEKLRQKSYSIKRLHLFDQKLATEESINKILNLFPKIERITLNCNHDLTPDIFKCVRKDVLQTLKLEFKWDMSMFFTRYYAYQYFPYQSIKKLQRQKEISLELTHKNLPRNNSLWIKCRQDLQWINHQTFHYSVIDTIRFNASFPLGEQPMKKFTNFTKIRVLVLSGSTIVQNSQFLSFIRQNFYIETLILDHCKFKDNLNILLNGLQNHQYLSKLSIVNEGMLLIDPQQIFRLTKLTHLNIQSSQFRNQLQLNDFKNLKGFSKMTKLRHLSLYSCMNQQQLIDYPHQQPLRTEFLSYLSKDTLRNLQFLNLGRSKVDNDACEYIRQMFSLQYLNIDHTRIEGEALVEAFRYMSQHSFEGCSLKHLSIRNRKGVRGKYAEQHLRSMAEYLPKLEYINIAYIQEVSDYDFSQFTKLKTIALSQSQFERTKLAQPSVKKYKIMEQD